MGFIQKKEDKFYAAWKSGHGRDKDGRPLATEWSISARRLAAAGATRAGDAEAVEEIWQETSWES